MLEHNYSIYVSSHFKDMAQQYYEQVMVAMLHWRDGHMRKFNEVEMQNLRWAFMARGFSVDDIVIERNSSHYVAHTGLTRFFDKVNKQQKRTLAIVYYNGHGVKPTAPEGDMIIAR